MPKEVLLVWGHLVLLHKKAESVSGNPFRVELALEIGLKIII